MPVNLVDKGQMNRRKSTNFISNFTCTRAAQKRKPKIAVRLKDLYTILTKGDKFVENCKTKEKGVGLLAVVSSKKVNICGK